MQTYKILLKILLCGVLGLTAKTSPTIFDDREADLNKILMFSSCTNKGLIDFFDTIECPQSINIYEFKQTLAWQLKYDIVQLIVNAGHLKNNTTFDAQMLHQLSGVLLSSSSVEEASQHWSTITKKQKKHPHLNIPLHLFADLYKQTQNYLSQEVSSDQRSIEQHYTDQYGPFFHDARQRAQKEVRSLDYITKNGLSIKIDAQFVPLIKQTFAANQALPLTDQLKNIRLLNTNGLKDSKVSFLCHDLFDHYWLFDTLTKKGFFERYNMFFKKIGNPQLWDIFSREGETIATIGFEYRLYLASHDYIPLFSLDFIKNLLGKNLTSENQKRALALMKSPHTCQRLLHALPIIYSGIIIELMEQRRKHGCIKIFNENNEQAGALCAFDPEYAALIVETCALLFEQEQETLDTLVAIAIVTEDYLINAARDKSIDPLIITLENIDRYKNKLRWFNRHPGFAATREIISKKLEGSIRKYNETRI